MLSSFLLELCGFACPVAQIVELGTADLAVPEHLDARDLGRVKRERTLDTDAE